MNLGSWRGFGRSRLCSSFGLASYRGLVERQTSSQTDVCSTQAPFLVWLAEIHHLIARYRSARSAHRRDMREDVTAAALRPDEAEALLIIPAVQLTA